MVNRGPNDESDDDDGALFFKNGLPVKFCFHKSVTQGRNKIIRDVERHGGLVVLNERNANVLLVDEQEDLEFLRRRYYSSTHLYRLSLYVEPRGFVQTCIRAGAYRHSRPVPQGMPGRPLGTPQVRIPFTDQDRDNLAYYIATRLPTRDGRLGNSAYKDLERLGQTNDRSWEWARRHTFHSWREHYKKNQVMMDARIDFYLQQLKGIGHHFGHDPRRHDFRHLRQEEEEQEEEEEGRGMRGRERERREQVRPAVANERRPDQVARDYLARHERHLVSFDEDEDEVGDGTQGEEEAAVEIQRAKRHRIPLDADRQRETQAKRVRVSDTSSNEADESDVEANADQGAPEPPEEDGTNEESQEIEGNDLFGDRLYDEGAGYDDFQNMEYPKPFSPRASPIPEQGPPVSTQATLIASPRAVEKEAAPSPSQSPTEPEAETTAVELATPPSSQPTMVVTQERVRGSSAQPGPSGDTQTRAVAVDAPFRNTRARSRSVEPQSQPKLAPREEDRLDGGNGKDVLALIGEDMPGEDDVQPRSVMRETIEDEIAVKGLLEDGEEDSDVDMEMMGQLPRYQDINLDEPLDPDDAETHESLVQGAAGEGENGGENKDGVDAAEGDESESDGRDELDEDDDADMPAGRAPAPLEPRVTRSMSTAAQPQTRTRTRMRTQTQSKTQAQTSPRRTRSRAVSGFPSPGTKARAMVNRFTEEERRVPYAPPQGTRAAGVRGRGREG